MLRARSKKRTELLRRKEAGEKLTDKEVRWLNRFKKSSEWANKVDELDDLVREIIKLRDPACVTCGISRSASGLCVGHLLTRGKHSVRWDLKNCNAQCPPCNGSHEYNPEKYTLWFVKKYGIEEYENLVLRGNSQFAKGNVPAIEADLRFELDLLKNL